MRYTKAMRTADFYRRMSELGFTYEETETLRRAELTLQSWGERECGDGNGCIERDEETGKAYWRNANTGRRWPIRDMEAGALRRIKAVMANHPDLIFHHQGDPRGCAVYILRKSDIRDGETVDSVYTRGFACCI